MPLPRASEANMPTLARLTVPRPTLARLTLPMPKQLRLRMPMLARLTMGILSLTFKKCSNFSNIVAQAK